jgi:phage tail sheath gpL-like
MELVWSAAAGGSAAGYKNIYVMGERVTAGTSVANEVKSTAFANADDAIEWFGLGSFGAWIATQVFRGGKLSQGGCKVFGVALTEPAGVAATQTFTFVGSTTSAGVFTVNIGGTKFSFSVDSGASITACGDALVAAWTALPSDSKPPFTPVNAIGIVTVTANNKGACANTAPTAQIITGDEPASTVLTVGGFTMTGGTLYPTLTTALANMTSVITPCIVHGWNETPDGSTAVVDLIRAHLETKCAAEVGHRGFQVTAWCNTSATMVTDRGTLDDDDAERARVGAMIFNVAATSPGTWHASAAAYMANAWGQQTDVAYPYKNVAMPYMVQPEASGDILTNDEIDTLLEAGLCPLTWDVNRARYLMIKGISARLFSGKQQPWAIVDGSDWFRYNLLANLEAAFPAGTKLAEDGETNLDKNTTTPAGVLDIVHKTIFAENMKGILRNRETLWAAATAAVNANVDGRVDFENDHAIMMGLYIIAGTLRQRGGVIGN